jgi:hypothetical protein
MMEVVPIKLVVAHLMVTLYIGLAERAPMQWPRAVLMEDH